MNEPPTKTGIFDTRTTRTLLVYAATRIADGLTRYFGINPVPNEIVALFAEGILLPLAGMFLREGVRKAEKRAGQAQVQAQAATAQAKQASMHAQRAEGAAAVAAEAAGEDCA